ncbi:MAG TPA: MarR family transcriptional regulator [Coriobacteriia bacterium]|nr:MarR family transcriptional regulator [Coriobacteriia bacterium]
MLGEPEFIILKTLLTGGAVNQRELAVQAKLSLGSVNASLKTLRDKRFLDGMSITDEGISALGHHKVDNAIIMAAGMSTRFAPLSYERPKGTLTVRGEVLIERIIRQLQEAGITDITIVIGYMKEQYLYLEDKFNVSLVVSNWYKERNNHSSLYLVREKLANTYIVTSDNYFVENPFESHVYQSYYSAIYHEGASKEYFLETGSKDRITKVTVGGSDGWIMYGHVYYDKLFSSIFASILEDTFELPETVNKLWEDIYIDHIKKLDMRIRRYSEGVIYEFDSLEEVRDFDEDFITNIDSAILSNIVTVLGCSRNDIRDITPIEQGLSNTSFYFKATEAGYVYRHPGQATVGLIDRAVEESVEKIAHTLGLDRTFVHLDSQTGWKISKHIDVSESFDYHNPKHVRDAMTMIHRLHDSGVSVSNTFDLRTETDRIKKRMGKSAYLQFADFHELDDRAGRIYEFAIKHGAKMVLSHNDFYDPNILVHNEELFLIDWEYSGMSDYASDLGTFICCSDYTYEQAVKVLEQYFDRELTPVELAHCISYVSLSGYYWFVWALNKEAEGESVGEYLYLWYRYAREYGIRAERLAQALLQGA